MGSVGLTEMVVILLIVILIFGAKKLPQLGEGVGKALSNFKKAVKENDSEDEESEKKSIDP